MIVSVISYNLSLNVVERIIALYCLWVCEMRSDDVTDADFLNHIRHQRYCHVYRSCEDKLMRILFL